MRCPRCGSLSVRRSSRVGAFERTISILYLYPFRCQRCTHRFRAFHRGQHYAHPTAERREFDRMVVRVPAQLSAGTETAEAETTDLSVTGCAVRTSARFPAGTEVRVTLRLGSGRTVNIAEAVVRAAHEGRISLQFVHVAIDDQRHLSEYINAIALPIDVGHPRRQARFPIEVVIVAVAGLLVIFLILSVITRIGTPAR